MLTEAEFIEEFLEKKVERYADMTFPDGVVVPVPFKVAKSNGGHLDYTALLYKKMVNGKWIGDYMECKGHRVYF